MSGAVDLADRHALVTGGGRGIGAAVVRALAELGANVTLAGRTARTLESTQQQLRKDFPGRKFFTVIMDVTNDATVTAGFAAARDAMGTVAVLVNNAGAVESALFTDTDEALFTRMVDVNLYGTFRCSRCVVGDMLDTGYGRIINIASTAGLVGYRYVSAYAAAKHGVVGLTRALALEVADTGVTVNAVCPGYVNTDMTETSAREAAKKTGREAAQIKELYGASNPGGRLLTPEEVAARVAWLCRPEQMEINGETVMIGEREEGK